MDDNTYECPQCGARIYPEQTRCSQCGQNMYPEDEETSSTEVATASPGVGVAIGAVLIGWMIASGIAAIFHFSINSFISPFMPGTIGKFLLLIAGPTGTFAGAVVCAGLVQRNKLLLGGLIGVLALPVSVLLATRWIKVTPELIFSPWLLAASLFIILAGFAGGWLQGRLTRGGDWKERWKVRGWEDLLYQDLLRKVRFNGTTADRLIEYERKQDPQANRLKLIQNAIERWERDNR